MTEAIFDLIFLGGGFSAGLAAYRIQQLNANARLLILETRPERPNDQTWSFQALASDVDPTPSGAFNDPRHSWLAPFLAGAWDDYEVCFPRYKRIVRNPYFSIRSSSFFDFLETQMPGVWKRGEHVSEWGSNFVRTSSGKQYQAACIIDCRGWRAVPARRYGYQKFVGLHVRSNGPHGVTRPILMDACVPQEDGYRFLYTLPWSRDELLIEDTHYSTRPEMDQASYEQKILQYAADKNWQVRDILHKESGCLPIPYHGEPEPKESRPVLGLRAGLFHATTGYSIYEAVLAAELLALEKNWQAETLSQMLGDFSKRRWRAQSFYRRLNNMLFHASEEKQRYVMIETFYRHTPDLLARFYAGYSSRQDKLSIIYHKPPVPLVKGIQLFFRKLGGSHGTV